MPTSLPPSPSRTQVVELGETVNFLNSYSVPRDGTSDVGAVLTQALADTAAEGKALIVPNKGFNYTLATVLTIPENAKLVLRGAPQFVTALGLCISVTGADAQVEGSLRVHGAHSSTSYHIVVQDEATRFKADKIKITNGNSGINVQAADCEIGEVIAQEIRGTAFKFSGASALRNTLGTFRGRNIAGFGVFHELGASYNTTREVKKYMDPDMVTAWQTANRPELENGQLGIEAYATTYGCEYNVAGYVHSSKSGDAGVTFSGSNNKLLAGLMEDGAASGVGIAGNDNYVAGVISQRNKTGFVFTPSFGGTSKRNKVVACLARDNETYGFNAEDNGLRLWVSGASYESATNFCYYGLNTYKVTLQTSVFGTTPPTHTSGTVSDGVNLWEYISSDTNLDSDKNVCIACEATGNLVQNWRAVGTGTLYVIGTQLEPSLHPAGQFVGANQVASGQVRGEGAVDLQTSRSFASQSATGDTSTIGGGRQNRASQLDSTVSGGLDNTALGRASAIMGGASNNADGDYSSAPGGRYADARGLIGVLVHSSTRFGTKNGSGQRALVELYASASGTTPAVLTTNLATVAANNQIVLPDDSIFALSGNIVCQDDLGNCAGWSLSGLVKRGDGAGTVAFVGAPTITSLGSDAGAASYTLTLTLNTTLGGVTLTGTLDTDRTGYFFGSITAAELSP